MIPGSPDGPRSAAVDDAFMKEPRLDRRNLLKAGFAATLGTAAGSSAAAGSTQQSPTSDWRIHAADGANLFVRDWGSGPPILFLAAWTLTSDAWGYQMLDLMGRGFRVVAYDRRGHGRSSDPGRYDYDGLADDLAAVIKDRGLTDMILVAHSMASGEVARYFARHGGRGVKRLMLVSPTTPFLTKTADNPYGVAKELMAAGRSRLLPDFPGRVASQIGPFFTPETSPAMVEWIKAMMNQTSLLAAMEIARLMQETDFRSDVAQINVPTLVIHGDKDQSAQLEITGRRTAALIPGARLKIYEGAPHGIPLTHANQLSHDLGEFAKS
jgi:non-heme chloroperoxidase